MSDPKCKICRRAGEKLFLKGAKCFTPKCAFERRPTPPGKPLSERKHRSNVTEYGTQLREKQKIRNVYGLTEKQFYNYVKAATATKGGNPVNHLFSQLERRLDNVVFRLGLSQSRAQARQMVSHGHFTVGKRRVTIPSYTLDEGDVVSIREGSRTLPLFAQAKEKLSDGAKPNWMVVDPAKLTATVTGVPKYDKGETGFDFSSVIEFYSR
jgi:small subunit ribosomal protein S4